MIKKTVIGVKKIKTVFLVVNVFFSKGINSYFCWIIKIVAIKRIIINNKINASNHALANSSLTLRTVVLE